MKRNYFFQIISLAMKNYAEKNQDVPEKLTFPLLVFTLANVIFDKTLCDKICIKLLIKILSKIQFYNLPF